eukprot:scaffold470949_cov46-Prasinocladus_malaysianus.AAC.3
MTVYVFDGHAKCTNRRMLIVKSDKKATQTDLDAHIKYERLSSTRWHSCGSHPKLAKAHSRLETARGCAVRSCGDAARAIRSSEASSQ